MSKILLVEDNEMNRDMLSRRLERKGFEVIIAVDGQAGVDMASSASPDLILMEQKAREAGCDDYDTKPVSLNRLLEKIGTFLG